ncbi:MAG: hypothetical protein JNM25_09685 [Planctomycetes bacterium]|nr:hypothetical protein [Planctomycetota bacterium]
MREALGSATRTLDDWIDRFQLSGFVAVRAFDTESRGAAPDGAVGIQAASLFVEADVHDVGSAFLELRLDYFQEAGQNESGLGEAYFTIDDAFGLGADAAVALRLGRFDLPFGEYYLAEDPGDNRLIGFPAVIPYRWDEGVMAFADRGSWGCHAALTDGTYSRNSQSGIAPAVTARLHARPAESLYVSVSGMYIHAADASAICFGGSVITPVTGSATGSSPSTEVRSLLGSVDASWQLAEALHLQASFGGGRIDDRIGAFDRTILWWMVEPTVQLAANLDATLRWSGGGTFDDAEGFRFEARPYGNGAATYGFDLSSLQRVALGLRQHVHPNLIVKAEVGFDHFVATDVSGRPNDTRTFTAAEAVLTF